MLNAAEKYRIKMGKLFWVYIIKDQICIWKTFFMFQSVQNCLLKWNEAQTEIAKSLVEKKLLLVE